MTKPTPKTGLHCDLDQLIDWDLVMKQERYAGGHEDVLRSVFGAKASVIGWYRSGDYQGEVAIAYQFADGMVAVITDYYGSCSGCDAWDGCGDDDARKMVLDLVHNSRVFASVDDAKLWCSLVDSHEDPVDYPFEAAKHIEWNF